MVVRGGRSGAGSSCFRGDLRTEPTQALDTLLTRFAPLRLHPFHPRPRRDGVGAAGLAARARCVERAGRRSTWSLFVLTALSTLAAGALLTVLAGTCDLDLARGVVVAAAIHSR